MGAVAVIINRAVKDAEFRTIFYEHKDAVYRFVWRMTGSAEAADDITQDCFLALLRDTARYESRRGPLRPFLMGVARNLTLKRWRTENRWEALDDDAFVAEPLDPTRLQTAELVAKAIALLPPLQREALILAEYEELSMEDVASAVSAEVSTVKARIHRARENLRRMLAPLRSSVCSL
jgi:RNA polymerase sigma-70 factor, ECF subfamily